MKISIREKAVRFVSIARRVLEWWQAELREMAEEALSRLWPDLVTVIRLDATETPLKMSVVTRRGSTLLWQGAESEGANRLFDGTLARPEALTRPPRALEVLLPAALVLARTVPLPAAAEPRLRAALELQYKRLMPLPREQVLLAHRIEARDERMLTAGIATLRRSQAEPLASLGKAWGFRRVVAVAAAASSVPPFRFELSARERRAAMSRPERALRVGVAVCGAAFAAAMLFGWALHEGTVRAEIQALMEPAQEAAALSQQLETRQQVADLLEYTLPKPGFTAVMAELTTQASEDTWIYQLSRQGYQLHLTGEASRSSALALRLGASPMFGNVQLTGTTAATESHGRFEITLELGVDEP